MAEKLIGWDEDGIFLILEEDGKTIFVIPDFAEMTLEELLLYKERVIEKIHFMDKNEPKQKYSDERDVWEALHEDLEDIRDEVADYIDMI